MRVLREKVGATEGSTPVHSYENWFLFPFPSQSIVRFVLGMLSV